jgi:NhaA family Na+:H+ antiporter
MTGVSPFDPDRDHFRGDAGAPYELLLYGDYECPYTRRAMGFVKTLEQRFGQDLRFVYRHLPLPDFHPHADHAAQAAESAAAQGGFWALHDRLFQRPKEMSDEELAGHASAVGLDPERVRSDLATEIHAARVQEDVSTATAAGIRGTPSFVIGGVRHHGFYDLETLSEALEFG